MAKKSIWVRPAPGTSGQARRAVIQFHRTPRRPVRRRPQRTGGLTMRVPAVHARRRYYTNEPTGRVVSRAVGAEVGAYAGAAGGGFLAGPPGAIVGGAAGGMAGDALGGAAYDAVAGTSTQRNNMKRSVTNALADKSSIKKYNSKNSKVKRGKKVKVSPYLKKAVTQIMTAKDKKGIYHKQWCGVIGVWRANANMNGTSYNVDGGGFKYAKYAGVAGVPAASYWTNDIPQYSRVWHQALSNADAGHGDGQDLCFFTHAKFLDAASILWNRKARNIDATITAGNLNINTNANPSVSTEAYGGSQIKVKNSYVTLHLKNHSQRRLKLCIYICVPKKTGAISSPFSSFINAISNAATDGTAAVAQNLYLKINNNEAGITLSNPAVSPALFPAFNNTWKYEVVQILLAPGEQIDKTIQGPKNCIIDWNTLNTQEARNQPAQPATINYFAKKQVVALMMSIQPDALFALSHKEDGASTFTDLPWAGPATANSSSPLNLPVSCYVEEHYELYIPEHVGFVVAPDSGNQSLNQRKPSIYWGNFTGGECDNTETAPVISEFNEEDPATAIPASRFA